MGNNLSSTEAADKSGIVLSPTDRDATIFVGAVWGISSYVVMMLFSTCTLVDRWRGPYDKNRTGTSNVFAALVLSLAWPAVLLYLNANF